MRTVFKISLCFLMLAGCKTQKAQEASFFHQPNWWERRMDRLETWDRRHGYPIEKSKDVMICTMVATGVVVGCVACVLLECAANGQSKSKYKTPYTDDYGYPLPN